MKHLFAATALTLTIASPLTAGPVEDYTELREDVWRAAREQAAPFGYEELSCPE